MKKFKMVSLVISFLLLSSRVSPIQEESSDLERIVYSNKTVSTTNQQRIALLIGNQEYKKGRLDNPHNDVDGMEAALKEVGFQVRKLKDQSLWDMEQAIIGFGKDLKQDKNTVGLFYFSGHGMQYQGKNFLFPIGAMESVAVPGHLQMETLNAEYLLAIMKDAENRLNLVFLDACRNNPFHHKGWFKGNGLKKGLAPMPPPSGSLIAYATSANHQALSAKGQHNSPYILHLKQEILKPGISIFDMLTNVRVAVKEETHGEQEPDFYSGLDGKFCFKEPCGQVVQVQTQANSFREDKFFRDRLQDGGFGPEMVRIPAGRFQMGDIQGGGWKGEKPVHWVSVSEFAMGKYEVTFAEYDKFALATGRKKPDDEGWGRGHRPVINVSWNDAVAYAEWLSQQTGKEYRLPTEAEWEYAARAGTKTKYWWGNNIGKNRAACGGCGAKWGWDAKRMTAPVGSFAANPFGLHDTVGNVWEWTCSKYEDKYNGQEKRCTGENRQPVVRGGSWSVIPRGVRAAFRNWFSLDFRDFTVGFRLARITL
jgi:formylglycine-generating enzyme required for sulfatase activity